jgi:hypothetical protein
MELSRFCGSLLGTADERLAFGFTTDACNLTYVETCDDEVGTEQYRQLGRRQNLGLSPNPQDLPDLKSGTKENKS